MKLVTFRATAPATSPRPPAPTTPTAAPEDRGGVLLAANGGAGGATEHVILDLAAGFAWIEAQAHRPHGPADVEARYGRGVLGFVEHEADARPAADALALAWERGVLPAAFAGRPLTLPSSAVRLLAPIPRPPSLRDGYAFRAHVEAARRNRGLPMVPEFDAFPVFYFSNHGSVIGPGDVTVQARHLERLDYELEAAIVVGRARGTVPSLRNLTVADADRALFGMTIMNDWSARALQQEEMKLSLGPAKGKDFATSLGPWLVTADELAPHATHLPGRGLVFDMSMRASVNGRELSRGNLRDMTWTFSQILERASYGVDLAPGDVVGSGTCGTGCLLELNGARTAADPKEMWLQPGDVVVLEIDGLGRQESRVVAAPVG